MTPKQEQFVQEYLSDLNARQAALRAGYSDATATNAHRMLRRPEIAAAVADAKRNRASALQVTAERVIAEYARIAFANMADYVRFEADAMQVRPIDTLTADQTAAIAEVTESKTQRGGTVRFKLYDKLAALNALARHIGLGQIEPVSLSESDDASERQRDASPTDAFTIAREIAFALKKGEARCETEARRNAERLEDQRAG